MKHEIPVQHLPRQNHLLAGLPAQDYQRLLPDLEPVCLPRGWVIHGASESEKYTYFPTAGIVSKFYVTEGGASAGFALTGNEGVIGISTFLGGRGMPSQAVVLAAGYAYRLRADLMKREIDRYSPLTHLLLRYTQALIAQIGQTAVCNRHHSVSQQLCRTILSSLDRLHSDSLSITHEELANMLGVRREGVTEAAGRLQQSGLICNNRGRIAVLDRPRLEAEACECYAVVQREYERLGQPAKSTGNAGVPLFS